MSRIKKTCTCKNVAWPLVSFDHFGTTVHFMSCRIIASSPFAWFGSYLDGQMTHRQQESGVMMPDRHLQCVFII